VVTKGERVWPGHSLYAEHGFELNFDGGDGKRIAVRPPNECVCVNDATLDWSGDRYKVGGFENSE